MKLRFKLLALLMLLTSMAAAAGNAIVRGTVVDSATGSPVSGATVMLLNQAREALTDASGNFTISDADAGSEVLLVAAFGYRDYDADITIEAGKTLDLGKIKLGDTTGSSSFLADQEDMLFDQSALEDNDGNALTIGALTGASDNVYYNATNYDFSVMRFRFRGYDSEYQTMYINGVPLNDLARGRFNYSGLGGLNRAFRNRTNTIGLASSTYGFGGIGGSSNISTITSDYAPGFNGSVAYTNAAYMLRAMAMYSTGINSKGWGLTVSAIGRYADEGVVPGTFYHSGGAFISLEKEFNLQHSLVLTAWGAPTQRATNSPTYLEAYELADNNLYNPNWGWFDGKKRSAKIVETFDPTLMLNWIWKPNDNTSLNTSATVRWVNYSTSALNWYNAADPRPDYYRYLPSYYKDNPEAYDLYYDLWTKDESMRQIDWGNLYQTNNLNNLANENLPDASKKGSTYILENRHSNQFNAIFNTLLQHRVSSTFSLQGGLTANMTSANYYKTIRDLLGGEFWLDIDQFAERDFPNDPDLLQNDLLHPNRRVGKGDKFGYDYTINAFKGQLWIQNMIALSQWDINYALEMSYTTFQRDGHMQNGRAPENSFGKGTRHNFMNGAVKAGAVYKIDGRNYITAHAEALTRAPLFEYAYISPRIKDNVVSGGLQNEKIVTGDLSYVWNYRTLRGSIAGFWTEMYDQTSRTSFYDDQYSTFMNYVLKGVHTSYKGIELGVAYKVTPSVTASFAGTIASYRYKNRPQGVRSYENGMSPDTITTVYLKNFHIGGTPQSAFNVGIDWAAPNSWFFNVNFSWMGNAYVNLTPVRHEALTNLWTLFPDEKTLSEKIDEITSQEKLNDACTLNASIGKLVYINRKVSMNFNLNVDNILNKRDIMTYGYQQGRFDYTNYDSSKYPNRYSYAQGIKVFLNVGIRF